MLKDLLWCLRCQITGIHNQIIIGQLTIQSIMSDKISGHILFSHAHLSNYSYAFLVLIIHLYFRRKQICLLIYLSTLCSRHRLWSLTHQQDDDLDLTLDPSLCSVTGGSSKFKLQ